MKNISLESFIVREGDEDTGELIILFGENEMAIIPVRKINFCFISGGYLTIFINNLEVRINGITNTGIRETGLLYDLFNEISERGEGVEVS